MSWAIETFSLTVKATGDVVTQIFSRWGASIFNYAVKNKDCYMTGDRCDEHDNNMYVVKHDLHNPNISDMERRLLFQESSAGSIFLMGTNRTNFFRKFVGSCPNQ